MNIFQYPAKHPKVEHVKKNMRQTTMCEHVTDYLEWFEV